MKALIRSGHSWITRIRWREAEMAALRRSAAGAHLSLPNLIRYAVWSAGYLEGQEAQMPPDATELIERRLPEIRAFLEAARTLVGVVETLPTSSTPAESQALERRLRGVQREKWWGEIESLVHYLEAARTRNERGQRAPDAGTLRLDDDEDETPGDDDP